MEQVLTKEHIYPFWKKLLGLEKNEELEHHLELFFHLPTEEIIQKVNAERMKKEQRYQKLQLTTEQTGEDDFFKKEFDAFTLELQSYLDAAKIVDDKETFLASSLKRIEGVLEKELLPFIIDEAKLFFEENHLIVEKDLEDPLDYFIKNRFHTKVYRMECEVVYPQLFSLVDHLITSYLAFVKEILGHVKNDEVEIKRELFQENDKLSLQKIEFDSGDRHQGGKSVAKLIFDKGTLYYKPRSAQMDIHFYHFLEELSSLGLGCEFKKINILDKENYSYFEEISHVRAADEKEFKQYYEKLGSLLGILYTLNGTDFHSENIIANGSNPMLIDLESLFHSNVFINENLYDKNFLELLKMAEPSVIDVGILPKKIVKNYDSDDYSLEIGGIGADEAKPSPFKYSQLIKDEANEIKHVRSFGVNSISENNPVKIIKDEHLTLINSQMKKGFKQTYEWILKRHETYLELVNKAFSNLKIRVILRPTYLYAKLLTLSKNIYIMGNSVNQKILFSKLAYERENQMDFIYSEYQQLLNNDIPFFISNTSSCDISDYSGNTLGTLSRNTPLENVLRKIKKMSTKDLDNQLILIDQTINLKEYQGDETEVIFSSESEIRTEKPENDPLETAIKIGDLLLERAINCTDETITWISTTLLGKEEIEFGVGPVGNDVYLGNAGISMFLAYLYKYSNEERFKEAALKAVNYNLEFLEQEKLYENGNIGYYNGTSGILLSLGIINQTIPIPEFEKIVHFSLQRLRKLVSESNNYDLFTGSSGLISSLLELERLYPQKYTESLCPLIELSYKYLKKKAVYKNDVAYWETDLVEPYMGYAHGNAGILASLCKLKGMEQQLFGKEIVDLEFLAQINRYIDTAYNPEENNWSTIPGNQKYSNGWCHGVQGLLLAECHVLQNCPELSRGESYINHLVELVKMNGFGKNPSFCHGDLGSLKVLEIYAKVTNNQALFAECETVFIQIFEKTIKNKWKDQVLSHSESLGLMIGVSGWGYAVLDHLYTEQLFDFFKV